MSSPRVSIIILNWNGLADTRECLHSLQKTDYASREVIVVDNGSSGDDVRCLAEEFGNRIQIVRNERNYGFAGGNNIGIRHALEHSSPDYVLLLNNDTVVARDCLDELVRAGEADPVAGVLGPKMYYYDFGGRKDVIWTAGGRIGQWRPWVYDDIGRNDDDLPRYQRLAEVEWISGAAMMIKRRVLEEVSLLNTDYFFGSEDVEYCLKAKAHGFKSVYVPTARVWHKARRSMSRRGAGFADLPDYFRFLRRNFSLPVYMYHLLISPLQVLHRCLIWLRVALVRS